MPMTGQVLIPTLGSEPQVVTLALDLLIEKDYPSTQATRAVVVHNSKKAVQDEVITASWVIAHNA
jgi:hypothetical protein